MRVLIAICVLIMPVAANAAQTLPVRAGEHGEYSRLVIPNAPDDWRIATSNRKIEIAFPDQDYAFDLSDILEKRKAHRVLSAKAVTNGSTKSLLLSLTCDCPVRTSKSAENSIIIDIFNPSPVALTPDELSDGEITTTAEVPVEDDNKTPENLRAARDRMISLLAEARHQGVVQLKIDDERAEAKEAQATEITMASHEVTEPEEALVNETPLPDHDIAMIDTASCVDPALFAEPSETEGQISYGTIANLRQRFDITDDDAERRDLANTLAIAYLHIGFFEEASSVASSLARDGDGNMIVAAALADIASGSTARAKKTLTPYRACGPLLELAYAAAAGPDDRLTATMSENHVTALNKVTEPLRAPIAEALALNALETQNLGIARSFFEVAQQARGHEKTAALAIIERALGQENGAPVDDVTSTNEIAEIAQTPGPLQTKALAILAEDYRNKAEAAYDGLLDDIAAQSSNRSGTLSDARSAFTGAKALVEAGRFNEGIAVLDNTATSIPVSRDASQTLARSLIMNALQNDVETRLSAVNAFFQYNDFLNGSDTERDPEINLSVARELASYGSTTLVDRALDGLGDEWNAEIAALSARAALNGSDPERAIEIAKHGHDSEELSVIAIEATERLQERDATVAAITTAMSKGLNNNQFASAAWRSKDWSLVTDAYANLPTDQKSPELDARVALAALNAGKKDIPPTLKERLASDPSRLAAISHMFLTAPQFNIRAIDTLADYSNGVSRETVFMQTGLGAKGDGR